MHRYNCVRQRFNPETFLRLASIKFVGSSICFLCFCVCVCVYMCVHVCVHVCVCVTLKKKVPDECMASTTDKRYRRFFKQQQAQRKENDNKSKRPVSSVDHCHPYRRKRENRRSFLNLQMLQSTCFGTEIETGVDSGDDSGSACVCVCVRVKGKTGEVCSIVPGLDRLHYI